MRSIADIERILSPVLRAASAHSSRSQHVHFLCLSLLARPGPKHLTIYTTQVPDVAPTRSTPSAIDILQVFPDQEDAVERFPALQCVVGGSVRCKPRS